MRDYMLNFFDEFEYPADAKEELFAAFDKIYNNENAWSYYEKLINGYIETDSFNVGETLNDSTLAAREAGILDDQGRFLIFCCFSKHLKEMYEKRGIDLKIWYDSVCDLKYKAVECKNVRGFWGSFVCGWFPGFFSLDRFALGRLQFEKSAYSEQNIAYTKHGLDIKHGTPLLDVHIPSGSRLPHEEVIASYKMAYEFFPELRYNGLLPICAGSWLLHKSVYDSVKKGSNVDHFINDYEVITNWDTPEYPDCWRLFDMEYTGNPDDLPTNGSLRRNMVEFLRQGGIPGEGYGILIFDGEKVVNEGGYRL
ncbi:MAG: hypothetical protein IJ499_04680 [Clostridia bacterium]|nr:hypothetical protein [Clostridia bacterium]